MSDLSKLDTAPSPDAVTTEMLLAACAAVIPPASKADIERVMPAVHTIMLADGLTHGANADMVAAKIAAMIPFYKAMRPLDPYVAALGRDAAKWREQERMRRSGGHQVDEFYKD